jgi:hypothetical protein
MSLLSNGCRVVAYITIVAWQRVCMPQYLCMTVQQTEQPTDKAIYHHTTRNLSQLPVNWPKGEPKFFRIRHTIVT